MRNGIIFLLLLAACSEAPTAPDPYGVFVGTLRGDTLTFNTNTGSAKWRGTVAAHPYPAYNSVWTFTKGHLIYTVHYTYQTLSDRLSGSVRVDSGLVKFDAEQLILMRQ